MEGIPKIVALLFFGGAIGLYVLGLLLVLDRFTKCNKKLLYLFIGDHFIRPRLLAEGRKQAAPFSFRVSGSTVPHY